MSLLGNRVLRTEDPRFLTGQSQYVADIELPGAAHIDMPCAAEKVWRAIQSAQSAG